MHPEAARAQLDAIRALSVEERLCVAESLRAFAWELQASVIAQRHPGDAEALVSVFASPEYYVPPLEVIEEERQLGTAWQRVSDLTA